LAVDVALAVTDAARIVQAFAGKHRRAVADSFPETVDVPLAVLPDLLL
jgi:hypothetical protein